MQKAQAEIDAVVGINRLPDFNDRPYLPYVNAIIKETMRWQLILPVGERFFNVLLQLSIMAGATHMATEDDGYFIPEGTVVIGAAWYVFRICEKTLSIKKLGIGLGISNIFCNVILSYRALTEPQIPSTQVEEIAESNSRFFDCISFVGEFNGILRNAFLSCQDPTRP